MVSNIYDTYMVITDSQLEQDLSCKLLFDCNFGYSDANNSDEVKLVRIFLTKLFHGIY